MNKTVLACVGVSKVYKDGASRIQVLTDIDFEIQAGEMCAIIGNSGSGKSTLLHLLGGLDSPSEGEVRLLDRNFAKLSEQERCSARNRHLGFIYQFHHLLPEFTALENVAMPLLIRGMAVKAVKAKAEDLLERVGLKERMTHRPNQLSGGERQRVAIARALVTDPSCVLADEPTGDLDPRNAQQVFEMFMQLQSERQTSVIMVTHDMSLAKKARRQMTLKEGRLVEL